MTAQELKDFAKSAGAQGCGIAGVARFSNMPEGFRPTDVYSQCKSVVVMFKQMPPSAIMAENPIPYSHAGFKMYDELERLSMDVLRFCDSKGVGGILIPATTPYVYWDEENKIGKGILSLKHAAVLAGLGIMGRSTIFINRDYGNMVYLGAVLLDVELEQDPPVTDLSCPDGCSICIDNCKQKAIKNGTVDQKLCREHSFLKVGRGWDTYSCNTCRRLCPLRAGA